MYEFCVFLRIEIKLTMSIACQLSFVRSTLPEDVTLVAVSKTHPAGAIREAYDAGHRIFGESRPQELREKYDVLPKDIEWHMIGHLQTNKVKYIAPFVSLIHSVDSARLAETIQREAAKCGRTIEILLEIRVADEESKSGWELGRGSTSCRWACRTTTPSPSSAARRWCVSGR